MTLPLLQEQSAAGGLMQGLGLGIQQALPSISEMILNRQKQAQINRILGIGEKPGAGSAPSSAMSKAALDINQGKTNLNLEAEDASKLPAQGFFQEPIPQAPGATGLQITPEKILALQQIDPQMANTMAQLHASQQKTAGKENEIFAEQAKEFWKDIGEKRKKLPLMKTSLDAQINSILRGDVDPFSRGHIADIAKGFGAPSALVASLETPGSKEFKAGLKTYLASTLRDAFRGTTTGREIELAEGLLAQAGVSKEGNLASAWLLQSQAMLAEQELKMASEFRKAGYAPSEVPDLVMERLEPYRKHLSDQYIQAIEAIIAKK